MEAWRSPEVPRLPGVGQVPRLHDHSSGEQRLSVSGDPGSGAPARLYVCGITPYDSTHIGHTATYVAFDLLGRAWRDAGLDVRYVQNVTDVDDPLLERADQNGEDWRELATRQIDLFRYDMAALRVVSPDEYIGAVEAIPMIVEMIEQLRETGATYDLDGDCYFEVAADPTFGQVSTYTREQMLEVYADRGGDPDRPGKRDPLDCLLWLKERPGEPSWDSPLGRGRPGWHVECAAIAMRYLGNGFDVQGGGSDLAFPHHEMSASEAQVLTGERPFAHTYAYQGMVGLDGEKMSKSKGNLVFSAQLRADGVDPMAIRLAVLAHHYRDDWEWTPESLSSAEARLDRWRTAAGRSAGTDGGKVVQRLRDALADDLDAPTALSVVDEWADATLSEGGSDNGAPAMVRTACDALLGVEL